MSGSMPAPELPLSPIFLRLCVAAAEPEGQQIAAFHVLVINNVCLPSGYVQSSHGEKAQKFCKQRRENSKHIPASLFFSAAVQYLPFFQNLRIKTVEGCRSTAFTHQNREARRLIQSGSTFGLFTFSAASARPGFMRFPRTQFRFYDCARFARYPMMLSLISLVRARL